MSSLYLNEKGGKQSARERVRCLSDEREISLSVGMGLANRVSCSGYTYREAHIDSCCQLRGGWAIRLCEKQRIR